MKNILVFLLCSILLALASCSTADLLWKYRTDGAVMSGPATGAGAVYFGSYDKYIYAVNIHDGSLKWKYKTERLIDSSPAFSKGILYIGSWDGHLYAIDAESGTLKWKFKTG